VSAPDRRSPLAVALNPGRRGADGGAPVAISERRPAIGEIRAGRGREAALTAVLEARTGLALPAAGRTAAAGGKTAVWIAPGAWLVLAPFEGEGRLAGDLRTIVAGHGAVVDQTHGKAVLRIAGTAAPSVLDKGCRIDLHPRVFGPGRSAVTPIAHVNVILMQIDGVPTFELVVPATFSATFLEWLEMSAAEFGYTLERRAGGETRPPKEGSP
jgi:sarcosine oxidase subunit gamma